MSEGKLRLSIAVADDHLARLAEVAAACRAAGLEVEAELASLGVITGRAEARSIGGLRAVRGVSAVEPERAVRAIDQRTRP